MPPEGDDAGMDTPPRAYPERQPRMPVEGPDLVRLLDLLDQGGVTVWLDGG